jgi:hemerythrin superfamily protein
MARTDTATAYEDRTREELYELAQEREIAGRAEMNKEQLVEALEVHDLGPDAVELILRQHEEIRSRFAEFDAMSDRPSKKKDQLVASIVTDLVKHAEIEEQVFYPAVREEVDGLGDELDEDLEEHHAAELLMDELDGATSDLPRFDAKVTVLKENVLHHMEEEETDLLPEVREALDERRRRELGGAMVEVWRVAPTRPHPRTPDTPPANVVAGLQGAATDVAVQAGRGTVAQAASTARSLVGTATRKAGELSAPVREKLPSADKLTGIPRQIVAGIAVRARDLLRR